VVAALLIGLWSARLAGHIFLRVLLEPEDGRYRNLRSAWGDRFQGRLLWFYQAQAVLAVLFAVPVLVTASDPRPLDPLRTALAVALWLAAVGAEAVADRQLDHFRADAANRGRTCRQGLWRYSRHPNYFFEWLGWWPWVVLSADAPWGGLTLLGPVVMLLFLLFVTGVPATEARAAASRPDYADYRRTTSVFIPWFPRRGTS
jgi:steroid 5-alpha reductase family enzyme